MLIWDKGKSSFAYNPLYEYEYVKFYFDVSLMFTRCSYDLYDSEKTILFFFILSKRILHEKCPINGKQNNTIFIKSFYTIQLIV